jgi:ABC-type branched-subunit amino acid transport system permease subunit
MIAHRIDFTIVTLIAIAMIATLCASTVPNWVRYLGELAASTALASLGVMVLLRAGLLTFGQGLFYFVGGYAVALMNRYAGVSDALAAVSVAAVAAGLVASALGFFLARYRGIFFSMLTLALSMVMFGAATKLRLFGGSDGLNVGLMSYFGYRPRGAEAQWVIFVFCIWVWTAFATATHVVLRSRFGRLIGAVADNEIRVEYLGYSAKSIVWAAYAIAGVLAGAGGALAGLAARHVDPQFAYWTTAGDFIFVVLLSGQASVISPALGAFVLEMLRSYASAFFPNQWQSVFGAMMLIIVLFWPAGMDRLIEHAARTASRAVARRIYSLPQGRLP